MYNIPRLMRRQSASYQSHRHENLATDHVVPDPSHCVQCGICSFNCPIGIDVRRHVWLGKDVQDSYCLTCGECVQRCPRGVLRFERADLFMESRT